MSSSVSPSPSRPRPRPLLGVSLKMYFSPPKTASYITSLLPLSHLASSLGIDLFVIPDFLGIPSASAQIHTSTNSSEEGGSVASSPLWLGAQDCFSEPEGPYTGEVSPEHLAYYGVKLVELGHAERRRLFGETDASVAAKAKAVCAQGMIPLVCIGELEDKGVDAAVQECRPQVESLLRAIGSEKEVVLAYEPVWAIGKPKPAPAGYVVQVTKALREMAGECEGSDGKKRTGTTRVLYGGSAGPGLFGSLKDGVDGLFLGRFGHEVKNLEKVMREMVE